MGGQTRSGAIAFKSLLCGEHSSLNFACAADQFDIVSVYIYILYVYTYACDILNQSKEW